MASQQSDNPTLDDNETESVKRICLKELSKEMSCLRDLILSSNIMIGEVREKLSKTRRAVAHRLHNPIEKTDEVHTVDNSKLNEKKISAGSSSCTTVELTNDSLKKLPKYIPPNKINKVVEISSYNFRGSDPRKTILRFYVDCAVVPLSVSVGSNYTSFDVRNADKGATHRWNINMVPESIGDQAMSEFVEKLCYYIEGDEESRSFIDVTPNLSSGLSFVKYGRSSVKARVIIHFKNGEFNRPIERLYKFDFFINKICAFEEKLHISVIDLNNKCKPESTPSNPCEHIEIALPVKEPVKQTTLRESRMKLVVPIKKYVSILKTNVAKSTSIINVDRKMDKIDSRVIPVCPAASQNSEIILCYDKRKRKYDMERSLSNYANDVSVVVSDWLKSVNGVAAVKAETIEGHLLNLVKTLFFDHSTVLKKIHKPARFLLLCEAEFIQVFCAKILHEILKKVFVGCGMWTVNHIKEYLIEHGFYFVYKRNHRINYTKPVIKLPCETSCLPVFDSGIMIVSESNENISFNEYVNVDIVNEESKEERDLCTHNRGSKGGLTDGYLPLERHFQEYPVVRPHIIDWLLDINRCIGINIIHDDNFVPEMLEKIFELFIEFLLRKCLSVINSVGKTRSSEITKLDILIAIIRTKKLHFLTQQGLGKEYNPKSFKYKY